MTSKLGRSFRVWASVGAVIRSLHTAPVEEWAEVDGALERDVAVRRASPTRSPS